MNIEIKSVNFTVAQHLTDFINKKVGKLNTFFDNIIVIKVFLRLENAKDLDSKVAEISVEIPGSSDLFVKKQSKTFEESIDGCVLALKRQITKRKEKVRGV